MRTSVPSETSRLPSRPITRPSGSPRAPPDAATLTKAPVVPLYSRTVWLSWLVTSRPFVIIFRPSLP
jgi:hypothetical protein